MFGGVVMIEVIIFIVAMWLGFMGGVAFAFFRYEDIVSIVGDMKKRG